MATIAACLNPRCFRRRRRLWARGCNAIATTVPNDLFAAVAAAALVGGRLGFAASPTMPGIGLHRGGAATGAAPIRSRAHRCRGKRLQHQLQRHEQCDE